MVCFCALWERLLVRQQLAKLAYAIHKQSNIKKLLLIQVLCMHTCFLQLVHSAQTYLPSVQGSPLDLRRKTPLPAGTNTDTSPPRLMRGTANPLDTSGTVSQLTPPLAPGLQLPSLSKISNVSNSSTNASLSEEYSTEAELIGRQIGMLVHLMQVASAAEAAEAAKAAAAVSTGSNSSSGAAPGPAAAAVSGSDGSSSQESAALASNSSQIGGGGAAAVLRRYSSSGARSHKGQLSAEVLEAATQLLCIQVGDS
jgi:hypothetical protein